MHMQSQSASRVNSASMSHLSYIVQHHDRQSHEPKLYKIRAIEHGSVQGCATMKPNNSDKMEQIVEQTVFIGLPFCYGLLIAATDRRY